MRPMTAAGRPCPGPCAARAGEGDGPQQRGGADLGHRVRDLAGVQEALTERAVALAAEQEQDDVDEEQHDDRHHEELDLLHRLVDHRRHREHEPDQHQDADRDVGDGALAEAEDEAERRRSAGRPARPGPRDDGHHDEQEAPGLPQPREPRDRGLPSGEGVPLDLHVEEVLGEHADDDEPHDRQAHLRDDERPQHELPGPDGAGQEQDAGAAHLPHRQRFGQVGVRGPGGRALLGSSVARPPASGRDVLEDTSSPG